MRITFLTNVFPSPIAPTKGTFNLELARELAREHEVTVVCPIAWTDEWSAWSHKRLLVPRCRETTMMGIRMLFPRFWYPPRVASHQYNTFLKWSVRRALRQVAFDQRPDAVLGYWAHPDGAVAVEWARGLGIPGWIMVGGSDVLLLTKQRRRGRAVKLALLAADGVIAVSRDIGEKLRVMGLPDDKVHVVYRGVSTHFCPGDKIACRQALKLPLDAPVFIWAGRMVAVKGLDILLAAVKIASNHMNRFHMMLVGDGPLRQELQARLHSLGIADYVQIMGTLPHEKLAECYRAADWSILTSLSEGVPNVLLESHACGTPFISTAVGGIPEIALPGIDKLVPASDVGALAKALVEACGERMADHTRIAAAVPTLDSSARRIAKLLGNRDLKANESLQHSVREAMA